MNENEKNNSIIKTSQHPSTSVVKIQEGGWGWIICFASFWINGVVFGILNVYGVLIEDIERTFLPNDSQQSFLVAWVGSIAIGLTFLCSPLSSYLANTIGVYPTCLSGAFLSFIGLILSSFAQTIYQLYISYSLLVGIGFSLLYGPSIAILGEHFTKKLGIANGIAAMGSAFFTIFLPLILKELLIKYELRITLRIMGVICCTNVIGSCVYAVNSVHSIKKSPPTEAKMQNLKRYSIWMVGLIVALFGYFVPFFFLVKYAESLNLNGQVLLTCIGITSGIGRLLYGKLCDLSTINPILLQQSSFVSIGIMTMLLASAKSSPFLIIIALFIGLFDGGIVTLLGPIVFFIAGKDGGGKALGMSLGLMALPLTLGPPLAGYILDKTESFELIFILAGIPPIIGALIMLLFYVVGPNQSPKGRMYLFEIEDTAI